MTWLRSALVTFAAAALAVGCGDNQGIVIQPDGGGHILDGGAGCTVAITSPTAAVTTDSDTAKSGVQSDVVVTVGSACSGKSVTLSCGESGETTVAASGTVATFNDVTLCALDACPRTSVICNASVINGGQTNATATLTVETQAPVLTVVGVNPANSCGGSVSPDDDVDPNTAGTQVQVRVLTVVSNRWVETTPPGNGTHIAVDATGLATLTLAQGTNTVVGKAMDDLGLTGTSPACTIDLSTLRVSIATPANNASLGAADGTASGSGLAIQVCGTVGEPTTSTVVVTVDGNSAAGTTATIDDTATGHFCANGVVVSSGTHAIAANATSTTGHSGTARATVTVDLTAPPPPTGLTLTATSRATVRVAWTEPADNGGGTVATCTVKQSASPIPDGAAFDALPGGQSLDGVPGGTAQSLELTGVKTGQATSIAVRCFDAAGNGSTLLTGNPITLHTTQSATLTPTAVTGFDVTTSQFGRALAGADLNNDGFTDVIVGAPAACTPSGGGCTQSQGLVYIYMGSATGIGATPNFVIKGTDAAGFSFLGKSLAVLDWNHDGIQDLAVGAPFASGTIGKVFIYLGADGAKWTPTAGTTVLSDTIADVTITPDGTDTWLTGVTEFGWVVRALDADGDGRDDLLIGAPAADGFNGGAVLVHGPSGTPTGTLAIPGGLAAAGTTARGYMFDTMSPTGVSYGGFLSSMGKLGDGATPSGDTRDDFVVAPTTGAFGMKTGFPTLVVFYGEAQSGTSFTKVEAATAGQEFVTGPISTNVTLSRFGAGLGSITDQSDDGRRDLVVTDPTNGFGTVWIVPAGVPGNKSVLTDAVFTAGGAAAGAALGSSLAAPDERSGGDVDGDGIDDIVVGVNNTGATPPELAAWYGGSSKTAVVFFDLSVGPTGMTHGNSASWVGDVNNDGLPDLAWSDDGLDTQPATAGAVQVVY